MEEECVDWLDDLLAAFAKGYVPYADALEKLSMIIRQCVSAQIVALGQTHCVTPSAQPSELKLP